jgi:hypothetical protein
MIAPQGVEEDKDDVHLVRICFASAPALPPGVGGRT